MAKMMSYVIGILVAGLIVFGLHYGMQIGSPAYARQVQVEQAAEKTLDELEHTLRTGPLSLQRAAITAIGEGDDQIERRVKLIALATASSDQSMQSICTLAVQRLGDRVKPTVAKMLESSDIEEVRAACGIIRALGTNGDSFAEPMLKMLSEGNDIDRHAALYAIQEMSPEVILPGLDDVIGQLDEPDFNTQCQACFVLRRLGSSAKPAAERLVKLLHEGNVSTRSRAAQALAAIAPVEGYDIPGMLADALKAHSYMEKVRILEAIGDLGADALDHVDKIEYLIQNPKYRCAPEAALARYRVTGEADKALRVLNDNLGKRNLRISAVECLGAMGQDASDSVPMLIELLNDQDVAVVETVVLALRNIGPTAEPALPNLKNMVNHEDYLISVAVQEAIDSISGKTEEE